MKAIYLIPVAAAILLIGCVKPSDLAETLSPEDQLALDEMEHALESAMAYHDSLVWCMDTSQACVDSIIDHYEDELHAHLNDWEQFHLQYSHNNIDDDHHHGVEVQHNHGNPPGHDDEEEEEDVHGHSIESHHEFNEFVSEHSPYHTE